MAIDITKDQIVRREIIKDNLDCLAKIFNTTYKDSDIDRVLFNSEKIITHNIGLKLSRQRNEKKKQMLEFKEKHKKEMLEGFQKVIYFYFGLSAKDKEKNEELYLMACDKKKAMLFVVEELNKALAFDKSLLFPKNIKEALQTFEKNIAILNFMRNIDRLTKGLGMQLHPDFVDLFINNKTLIECANNVCMYADIVTSNAYITFPDLTLAEYARLTSSSEIRGVASKYLERDIEGYVLKRGIEGTTDKFINEMYYLLENKESFNDIRLLFEKRSLPRGLALDMKAMKHNNVIPTFDALKLIVSGDTDVNLVKIKEDEHDKIAKALLHPLFDLGIILKPLTRSIRKVVSIGNEIVKLDRTGDNYEIIKNAVLALIDEFRILREENRDYTERDSTKDLGLFFDKCTEIKKAIDSFIIIDDDELDHLVTDLRENLVVEEIREYIYSGREYEFAEDLDPLEDIEIDEIDEEEKKALMDLYSSFFSNENYELSKDNNFRRGLIQKELASIAGITGNRYQDKDIDNILFDNEKMECHLEVRRMLNREVKIKRLTEKLIEMNNIEIYPVISEMASFGITLDYDAHKSNIEFLKSLTTKEGAYRYLSKVIKNAFLLDKSIIFPHSFKEAIDSYKQNEEEFRAMHYISTSLRHDEIGLNPKLIPLYRRNKILYEQVDNINIMLKLAGNPYFVIMPELNIRDIAMLNNGLVLAKKNLMFNAIKLFNIPLNADADFNAFEYLNDYSNYLKKKEEIAKVRNLFDKKYLPKILSTELDFCLDGKPLPLYEGLKKFMVGVKLDLEYYDAKKKAELMRTLDYSLINPNEVRIELYNKSFTRVINYLASLAKEYSFWVKKKEHFVNLLDTIKEYVEEYKTTIFGTKKGRLSDDDILLLAKYIDDGNSLKDKLKSYLDEYLTNHKNEILNNRYKTITNIIDALDFKEIDKKLRG